ncbi:hypothetical protein C8Q80DRAFT_687812 [Daedaleopsis nitida]|nr:hypothetical protein C8Q80DRAFT_687812 [Daedaleopsis nitida]
MDKPKISENSRMRYWSSGHRKASPQAVNTKGKKPTGRNVGKLVSIMKLPVDVFLEIASHLHPLDLLQLSRASNELRDMLMSRQTRSLWVAARKAYDPPLPDCPDDLSEPKYASLVFELSCMACGAGRAVKVGYAAYVRFCGPCWKTNVKAGHALAKEARIKNDPELMEVIYNMLPAATQKFGYNADGSISVLAQNSRCKFYEAEFIAVVKQYDDIFNAEGAEALEAFEEDRRAIAFSRVNFQHAVLTWNEKRAQVKIESEDRAEAHRKAAILEKLKELGYEETDYPRYNSEFEGIVSQPRPLTPRIWNTIRPKLVEILEAEHARRKHNAFVRKWEERRTKLGSFYKVYLQNDRKQNQWKRIMPNVEDALALPCMHELLTSADPEEVVTEEQFIAIEARLKKDAEAHRAMMRRELVAILKAQDVSGAKSSKKSSTRSKRKRTATTRKRKGKKRAETSSDEESESDASMGESDEEAQVDDDAAAELALLDRHTSLFRCRHCFWDEHRFLTYHAVLEHWQTHHAREAWGSSKQPFIMESDADALPGHVRTVLDALGFSHNTGLTELHRTISGCDPGATSCQCRPGPICFMPRRDVPLTLGLLIGHISGRNSSCWGFSRKCRIGSL